MKPLNNYIGGEWLDAEGDASIESVNPGTGQVIGQVPLSGSSDIDLAVKAAQQALPEWRAKSPQARARVLFSFRELLVQHQQELAEIVCKDMGKTLSDAFAEVGRGIESVEAASAVPHLLKGQNLEGIAGGVDIEMVRQPVGVVAAITPFNFPAMIPLWFLPFAIGCGNTFILKPSERDPLVAQRMYRLLDQLQESGELPAGVVNLVHGAHDCVNGILEHPGIDAVSFVGKASTARYVATRCAESGKRYQALGGAKNALVLMPDADPQTLVKGVMNSAFGAAGQRCLAGSVAVLVGSKEQQDHTLGLIVEAAAKLIVGNGLDATTDVCPLVSSEERKRVEGDIEGILKDGAQLVLDGRITDGGDGGALLGPTILEGNDPEAWYLREELFGPVLAVLRVDDLTAAIDFINAGRYGNAAMIFTEAAGAVRQFRYDVQAGMIGVNVGVAAPVAWFPFAGWGDSFDGDLHANGDDAVEFYTRKKVLTSSWRT